MSLFEVKLANASRQSVPVFWSARLPARTRDIVKVAFWARRLCKQRFFRTRARGARVGRCQVLTSERCYDRAWYCFIL